jgi:hypothetical protein
LDSRLIFAWYNASKNQFWAGLTFQENLWPPFKKELGFKEPLVLVLVRVLTLNKKKKERKKVQELFKI